ncbi:hypothetical protein [Massilibacteroides sp.]|uniref:hypothetical protein n=1 Tax=Massilibacteroides sp. TaxID=2034766 RepID=UPI00261CEAB4|nr:hypothetical protein [Massilibacteroides sp.]MDD4515550.1 hypothetical protein [Massilibacteroides sp.]
MKEKCVKYMKFALPVLFILYMGGIISFTHVHIINGVTIVHSHPYSKNADGSEHEHTGTELQLLHQLSTIQQVGSCLFDYTINPYTTYAVTINNEPVFHTHISKINKAVQLRAPPVLA